MGFVMSGDKPAELPAHAIESLKGRCDAQDFYISPPASRWRRGQRLRVERGALRDQIVIYQGMAAADRCNVLIQLLGTWSKGVVKEGDLALAAA